MAEEMNKRKSPIKVFITVFAALAVLVILQNIFRKKIVFLDVSDNAGVSVLKTIDNSLVGVYQDGRIVSWDWRSLPEKTSDFKIGSDRVVVQDAQHLASVSKVDRRLLIVYDLKNGQKQKELAVGWEDQDIWLRLSPDKNILAVIRRNESDSSGNILYEFLTVNMEKKYLSSPVTLSIQQSVENLISHALDNNGILYVVGRKDHVGRIAAVDLLKATILWDTTFESTKEFCDIAVSSNYNTFYAGNRDGFLYKLNSQTGQILKKIQLLEDGETRLITNDYSVLNLAFSNDGKYFAATINPKVYILKSSSDDIIHTFSPADRLVSKIAFSPDNQFIATSDIRRGYPIKIWEMPTNQ